MPSDEISTGELGRRLDDLKLDVRDLTHYLRSAVEALPSTYMPRTELEARLLPVERATAASVGERISNLRQALNLAVPSLISLAALAVAVIRH